MRRTTSLLLAALLGATGATLIPGPAQADPAPVYPAKKDPIAGQYTVVLKAGADVDAALKRLGQGAAVAQVYRHAVRGFTLRVDAERAKKIAQDKAVRLVQQDATVQATDELLPAITQSVPAPPDTYWGLNRIDQRDKPANAAGSYRYYWTGSTVTAYVIDSGINYSHTDFGGRASLAVDLVGDGYTPAGGDCYGHGTHVAGTIGGKTYGVAKSVKLKSVRVLDGSGSAAYSTLIAGLDWIKANAAKPAVVNLSLGGFYDQATDLAMADLIASGITAVVSAGNSADDACFYSPASTSTAITVGATGDRYASSAPIVDVRSDYSNYGTCLDLFAPGSLIKSAYIGSSTATATFSGTSMAAPHVAGVAALYLVWSPSSSPATVRNYLVSLATTGKVTSPGTGSPNRLLYAGGQAAITFNASPEPLPRNASLKTSGTLTLAGRALSGRTVEIWFDRAGTTAPVKVGTATTSSTGAFSRTQPVTGDGDWYAKFLSRPLIAGVTSAKDAVDCNPC